ncbi:uncharacterized protein LOC141628728 [Silene latifolia]|uniref:uncharacterized protein LOC141628728 n=1 Tax=Silene latifolia TaxID=37657 RepID=UPI003D76F0A2
MVVIPDVTMFPYCTVVSAATTLPIDDMKEQIDHTLQIQDPPSNDTGNKIGSDKEREYHYRLYSQHEVKEAKGFEQESSDEVVFNWRYIRLMKEASSLSDRVSLHLLEIPEHHALFQFHMGELADLLLIKKSVLVVPHMSAEEDAPDEDVSGSIPPDTVSIS